MRTGGARTLQLIAITLTAFAFMAACATIPSREVRPRAPSPPKWVHAPPKATDEFTYFVGSGSDASGNSAAAEQKAIQGLAAQVADSIGAGAGGQLTPATRADLRTLEQRLREGIRDPSTPGLKGFAVTERWVEHNGGRVTLHLLARYRTSALEAERSRLAALERERTDPVAVPQTRGEELLANGKPYAAAVQFMEAALAATRLENAAAEFQTNIEKAEAAVADIRLETVTNDIHGQLDRRLPKPFLLEVTAGGKPNQPVPGARFRISYPVLAENGTPGTVTMAITEAKSDSRGRVSIDLPSPHLFGEQTVTAVLDLSSALDPLLHAPGADQELVTSLEKKIDSVRAVLRYHTTSEAASVPTGVLVMDLDRGGSPIPGDDTAVGIESALTNAGFNILPIPSNRSILGIDLPDLVKILRNNFAGKIRRAIVGQAQISGFEHTDGNYVVKVSGHIEVADLASGNVLFSTSQVKLSRASDASSAINAAFKDLGKSIATEIKNRLH